MDNSFPMRVLCRGTSGWPVRLDDLPDPPAELAVRGAAELPRLIAIVGTRAADVLALQVAADLAAEAVALGFGVVSGGAMGVDAAAHAGAIATGGVTLAILAGSPEQPGPRRNAGLFDSILRRGGGLWSGDAQAVVGRSAFPRRNRLIAAVAELVVIVQARDRSGSLSTASHARRLRRPLAVVAGSWGRPGWEGGAELLASGARCLPGPGHLATVLGLARGPAPQAPDLDAQALRVAEAVRAGAVGAEAVSDATGLPLRECVAALVRIDLARGQC